MGDDSPDDSDTPDDPETPDHRENPFEDFDDQREREGDPFASLGDGPGDDRPDRDHGEQTGDGSPETGADLGDDGADPAGSDPFEYVEDRGGEDGGAFGSGGEGAQGARGEGDPLAGVDVSDADPFESSGSAFESAGVEGIDPDDVWERLTADPAEREDAADRSVDPDGDVAADEEPVEVSKHAYCEGCEHFSAPPEVSCSHEGTSIVEFVDVETVRVANCPVVAERRELEEET